MQVAARDGDLFGLSGKVSNEAMRWGKRLRKAKKNTMWMGETDGHPPGSPADACTLSKE
jgi:hypothetical protein